MVRLFLLALATTAFWARAEFVVPPLTSPVEDPRNVLTTETRDSLRQLLRDVRNGGGSQIQVLIVDSLEGLSIEEASLKVVEQWKLGSAKADDGVLLFIAMRERRVRIEVGQGREGELPDVIASRIIRNVIVPHFRENDPDRAVTAGVYAILHYTDPDVAKTADRRSRGGLPSGAVIFFYIVLFLIFMMPGLLGFRRRRRSWWMDGGGGFGGFGGGGFGGGGGWSGGGGGFSGGGASGGW